MPGPLTRRGVLALGGLAAVAACSPSGALGGSGVEHRDGVLESASWPGREVRWRLALPRTTAGLVVVLHGKGGDADSAFDDLRLDDHVAATGLAVASVDGGTSYWHPRRDGTDTGALVTDDLLPLLRDETGRTGPVGLLGWSMGGYGALLLAGGLGDRVGAVAALSAALWTEPGLSAPGAFDDREDFEAHDVFAPAHLAALAGTPVRLDCGEQDPFVAGNRALAEALPSATSTVDAGGHDVGYWRSHAGPAMRWLAEQLV